MATKAKVEATLMLSNHFAFLLLGVLTILHMPLVMVRSIFKRAYSPRMSHLSSPWATISSAV